MIIGTNLPHETIFCKSIQDEINTAHSSLIMYSNKKYGRIEQRIKGRIYNINLFVGDAAHNLIQNNLCNIFCEIDENKICRQEND